MCPFYIERRTRVKLDCFKDLLRGYWMWRGNALSGSLFHPQAHIADNCRQIIGAVQPARMTPARFHNIMAAKFARLWYGNAEIPGGNIRRFPQGEGTARLVSRRRNAAASQNSKRSENDI